MSSPHHPLGGLFLTCVRTSHHGKIMSEPHERALRFGAPRHATSRERRVAERVAVEDIQAALSAAAIAEKFMRDSLGSAPHYDETRVKADSPKICVVVGTRPEIVKLAPVVKLLGAKADVVYTGQHYDEAMAGAFFDAFSMSRPSAVVDVGRLSRGEQLGVGTSALTRLFSNIRPEAVVVQGDTNSALAGALAANSVQVPLVHVEAGLRSFDRAMPEEHNRVLVDHLSDLLLAPTNTSLENLTSECCAGVIKVTGNTVVEAVNAMLPDVDTCRDLLDVYGLGDNGFVLATIHRPENTDNPNQLRAIFASLQSLDIPVLVPLHPRTADRLRSLGTADLLDGLQVIEPVGYSTFLGLASRARLLITDSGGVQEEASVIKRPAVVVRRSTERPEVMGTFTTLSTPAELATVAREWLQDAVRRQGLLAGLPSPYGAGDAGRLSVKAIEELVG